MGAFSLNRADFTAVVDVDDRMLEEMPGFEEGELPDTADLYWSKIVAEYWQWHQALPRFQSERFQSRSRRSDTGPPGRSSRFNTSSSAAAA